MRLSPALFLVIGANALLAVTATPGNSHSSMDTPSTSGPSSTHTKERHFLTIQEYVGDGRKNAAAVFKQHRSDKPNEDIEWECGYDFPLVDPLVYEKMDPKEEKNVEAAIKKVRKLMTSQQDKFFCNKENPITAEDASKLLGKQTLIQLSQLHYMSQNPTLFVLPVYTHLYDVLFARLALTTLHYASLPPVERPTDKKRSMGDRGLEYVMKYAKKYIESENGSFIPEISVKELEPKDIRDRKDKETLMRRLWWKGTAHTKAFFASLRLSRRLPCRRVRTHFLKYVINSEKRPYLKEFDVLSRLAIKTKC